MKHVQKGMMRATRLATALLVGLALAGPAVPAQAEPDVTIDYIVDNPTDVGGGACLPATDDDCSLRSAIQQANLAVAGATKRIRFQSNYNINLTTLLPAITNPNVDLSAFDGGSGITRIVRVKGSGTTTIFNGNVFQVLGNNARIDSLRIYGSATGWSNIFVTGSAKNVTISNNLIGSGEPDGCPVGVPVAYGGVYVDSTGAIDVGAGEARAWIWGNNFRCFDTGNAIEVNGTNRVYIGSDNDGLVNLSRRNLITGSKNGVVFSNGANFNFLRNASIQFNTIGVLITGNTFNNFVTSSLIRQNTVGVQMDAGANLNLIGTNSLGTTSDANFIRENSDSGVVISGATTQGNSVHGNVLGRGLPTEPASHGNSQFGVKIMNGAYQNYIGFSIGSGLGSNTIGGNGIAGVGLYDGAKDNEIVSNMIGAVDNVNNPIPNATGVIVAGNASTGNKIRVNLIARNMADGVLIDGARNTTVGDSNAIALNGRDGVLIQNGAKDNIVRDQTIYTNGRHGISLRGAGTNGNQVKSINTF